MANYYAYRIFLNQPEQLTLFIEPKTKADLLNQVIQKLSSNIKLIFSRSNKKYIFYYIRRINGTIHLLQMAREDRIMQPQEGDKSIEEKESLVTPNIYFILDVEKQIILIQEKLSVFHSTDPASNRISEFFENQLADDNVTIKLHSISKADDFWREIKEAEEIYSLDLDIAPPNFFKTRFKSNIDIKDVYEETFFTKLKISIKNKFGKLKLQKEDFQDLIQTLASGAGDFAVDMVDKLGKRIKLTKSSRTARVELPDNTNQIDGEKLRDDINYLDSLNDNPSDKTELSFKPNYLNSPDENKDLDLPQLGDKENTTKRGDNDKTSKDSDKLDKSE